MTRLSVNINKIATLRNSRGGNIPNVMQAAIDCEKFGAEGITVHPRPDERHITRQDVYDLKPVINTEFNIEGYPSESFLALIAEIKPAQATLVPDPPNAITSNQGWDTVTNYSFLNEIIQELTNLGVRSSIFVGTELKFVENAAKLGSNRIELYTEPYANEFTQNKQGAVEPFTLAAKKAIECGLEINAGHDLNLENLKYFKDNVPGLEEVSIGHALIADALYLGLEKTISLYLDCLK